MKTKQNIFIQNIKRNIFNNKFTERVEICYSEEITLIICMNQTRGLI